MECARAVQAAGTAAHAHGHAGVHVVLAKGEQALLSSGSTSAARSGRSLRRSSQHGRDQGELGEAVRLDPPWASHPRPGRGGRRRCHAPAPDVVRQPHGRARRVTICSSITPSE